MHTHVALKSTSASAPDRETNSASDYFALGAASRGDTGRVCNQTIQPRAAGCRAGRGSKGRGLAECVCGGLRAALPAAGRRNRRRWDESEQPAAASAANAAAAANANHLRVARVCERVLQIRVRSDAATRRCPGCGHCQWTGHGSVGVPPKTEDMSKVSRPANPAAATALQTSLRREREYCFFFAAAEC